MSLRCSQTVRGSATFCLVPTPPTRGSANGSQTRSATSAAQMVSESTRATSGVLAASQPRRRASRLPGTSVGMTRTGYWRAMRRQASSVRSMTQMTSSTRLASQDSSAWRKTRRSSW